MISYILDAGKLLVVSAFLVVRMQVVELSENEKLSGVMLLCFSKREDITGGIICVAHLMLAE